MFEIGATPGTEYPGLTKIVEECGELLQIIGKLMATGGNPAHWSGSDLRSGLLDEMADAYAAVQFAAAHCFTPAERVRMLQRVENKMKMFRLWQSQQERKEPT